MIKEISLEGQIQGGASLDFLAVEVPFEPDRYIPFALVRYAIDGMPQRQGLRLDLDKRTFADQLKDPERDAVLAAAVDEIVRIVTCRLRYLTYERLRKEFAES